MIFINWGQVGPWARTRAGEGHGREGGEKVPKSSGANITFGPKQPCLLFGTTPLILHSLHFLFEPWSCYLHRMPKMASQYALANAATYQDYPLWAISLSNVGGGDSHREGFWFICVTESPRAILLFRERVLASGSFWHVRLKSEFEPRVLLLHLGYLWKAGIFC